MNEPTHLELYESYGWRCQFCAEIDTWMVRWRKVNRHESRRCGRHFEVLLKKLFRKV